MGKTVSQKTIYYINLTCAFIAISLIIASQMIAVKNMIYLSLIVVVPLMLLQIYWIYLNNQSQKIKKAILSELIESKKSLGDDLKKIANLILEIKSNKSILLDKDFDNEISFDIENIDSIPISNNDNEEFLKLYKNDIDETKRLFNVVYKILEFKYNRFTSLYKSLDTLCPSHISLDLSDEWNEFIQNRFTAAFNAVKGSIHTIEEIQQEGIEYVQYILEILKGLKNKRETHYDQLLIFFSKMRNTQKSFASYLNYISENFRSIKDLMTQVEEITDKINILSLNMSIEANKLTGSNVFTVIAKELHLFSEQTMKYFEPIKKTIEQNLLAIESKKIEEEESIKEAQEYINISEKTMREYTESINNFTDLVDSISKNLIKQEADIRKDIFTLLEDMQKLAVIEEEIRHRNEFHEFMQIKTNTVIQQILRNYKKCDGFNCIHRQNIFELLKNMITTADERNFLSRLYKKYLNKELDESEHKQGDVLLF